MKKLMPSLIVTIFSFGGAIFYALSCIERSVLKLGLNQHSQEVDEKDIRFVHASLKRLIPLLPPSNGVVIVFGTGAMVYQGFTRNWDRASIAVLAFYWSVMGYLISFGKIAAAVKDVRAISSDSSIEDVRRGVARLIVRHHIGLIANLGAVMLEFILMATDARESPPTS
jgi:hypothetical protein